MFSQVITKKRRLFSKDQGNSSPRLQISKTQGYQMSPQAYVRWKKWGPASPHPAHSFFPRSFLWNMILESKPKPSNLAVPYQVRKIITGSLGAILTFKVIQIFNCQKACLHQNEKVSDFPQSFIASRTRQQNLPCEEKKTTLVNKYRQIRITLVSHCNKGATSLPGSDHCLTNPTARRMDG